MLKQFFSVLLVSHLIVFGTVERIQKALVKKEYEKAYELIQKGFEKEPLNPGINYYKAFLFFEKEYAGYNLDTSRIAINESLLMFEEASSETLEDLAKEDVTEEDLIALSEKIRDESYRVTTQNLSLSTIDKFFLDFPNSIYQNELQFKKDSIDFGKVSNEGTQEAFIDFINSHQVSIFTKRAEVILDEMRFAQLENQGTLDEYYEFLKQYPKTQFREKIEAYILKVSTASHRLESYEAFYAFSKVPSLKRKAQNVMYFLERDYPFKNDSLRDLRKLEKTLIYPIVEHGLIGFYDLDGEKRINNLYKNIPEAYKCGLTSDDWIFVHSDDSGLIINKSGRLILQDIDDYESLGADLALVEKDDDKWLYHKSGYRILDVSIQEAELIDDLWIKVKQRDKWGLSSYLGLQIAESIYDDIYKEGHFWIFEKDGLIAVYTEDLILSEIEDRGLSLEFKFDDIEMVNDHSLIGFREERECLLDSTLSFLVPWGTYEINPETSGWYLKSEEGYRLYNESEEEVMRQHYPYLETNSGWLAIQTENDWMLLPRGKNLLPSREYDSIKLINDHSVILIQNEIPTLMFLSGNSIDIADRQIQTFPNQPDYLSISDEDKTALYNQNGELVIDGKFEQMQFLNDTLIKVLVKDKYGLISTNGNWILNPVFDTLDEKDDLILTLIKGKIGCYDPIINELMETEYEARIQRIGKNYLAKKDGKFGVIDFVKTEILPFEYDEISIWNDSTFLTKMGNSYSIIKATLEPVYDDFQFIKLLTKNDSHSIFRFVKDGKYGLLSNAFGELLEAEFTDILNISTEENPFFFADQHLDKAGFHVVSYINEQGKLVLSKAYTRDEFDKILCDD